MSAFTEGCLSRVVPTHRKTVAFSWIKHDFMLFITYRQAREKRASWRGMKIEQTCFWCKSLFKDEDMLALAHLKNGGANKLLCQQCASAAALGAAKTLTGDCSDCPPVGYPTDETRCDPCPRKAAKVQP